MVNVKNAKMRVLVLIKSKVGSIIIIFYF